MNYGPLASIADLYRRAIVRYGATAQMDQCVEEMAELTVELQHAKRNRPHHAAEEVADCLIMVGQMRELFGPGDVDAIYAAKLHRLQQRLDGVEG